MASSGKLLSVALVRIDVSEGPSASIIRVIVRLTFLVRSYVLPKCRFLQEPYGVTSQTTPFFIVTAVKTSNMTISVLDFWLLLS
jgi:hypothetical protein